MYGQASMAGSKTLPDLPDVVAHVWGWFCDLRNATSHDRPVSYHDIAAYFDLTGHHVTPWEVELIRRLDGCWLADVARKAKQASRRSSNRQSTLSG